MLRSFSVLAATAAMCLALPTAAAKDQRVRDAVTADQLKTVLTDAGLSPTMLRDKSTGAPVATGIFYDESGDGFGSAKRTTFVVRGMDCSGVPIACSQLVLYANFDIERDITEQDFRVVNEWNDTSTFGRAFVIEDKQKVGVDFRLDMIGGVTGDHVSGRVGRWPDVLRDFRSMLEDAQGGS